MVRQRKERRIFFPWEAKGGLRRYFAARRVAPPILLALALLFCILLFRRERRMSGERKTRATLMSMRRAVSDYMAQSEGKCPESLRDVLPQLRTPELPRDGWGRHFRLLCPVEESGRNFIIISDGADGRPGGRDRIEF